jgi:hypothetical protein
MVSLAKLLRIRQGIEKKYKNMGLEKFLLSINNFESSFFFQISKLVILLLMPTFHLSNYAVGKNQSLFKDIQA